jgi:hypothetical protein
MSSTIGSTNQRPLGAYYTPDDVAQRCVSVIIELSAIRGQPEHAERERLLSAGLLAMEEYMAARWVKPREPAPVLE